jgi:hypothetical protein
LFLVRLFVKYKECLFPLVMMLICSGSGVVSYDCTSSCASVLDPGGSGFPSFVDSSALWIWNNPRAAQSAPATTVEFVKTFYVVASHPCITGSTIVANMYVCVDDYVTVYLNENVILQSSIGCSSGTFSISSVRNTMRILATNYVGPAALRFAIYCQNNLMLHSDGSWCSGSSCSTEAEGTLCFVTIYSMSQGLLAFSAERRYDSSHTVS